MTINTQELLELLPHMTEEERAEVEKLLRVSTPIWCPQPGPQTEALLSKADILYYGGQAGGGKTDLLLGVALTQQERSILFRRQAVQLTGIEERMATIIGTRAGYNSQTGMWRLPEGGRTLELGSCKEPGDWMKYQGRPHDAKLFDEIPHFTETQFRSLIGWMRTDNPKVRQRVICAGNPPTDSDGEWVIRYWAPWLDPQHANPAKPGELRWFITNEHGEDQEVPDSRPVKVKGRWVNPKSRTFIRSTVDDNVFLSSTGYRDTLMALPEPLRSQMAEGNFLAGLGDAPWQLIPTSWVDAAQARWRPLEPAERGPMTRVGFDVAIGGQDKSTLAPRHTRWFGEFVSAPGKITTDGPKAAAFIVGVVRDGAMVCVDSIGVGTTALDHCRGLNLNVHAVVGSEGTKSTDKTGELRFRNVRAEMYWRLREAMDPDGEDPIALPPDKELRQELLAHRYKVVQMGPYAGIQVRSKDEVKEAIGRSPDKSDSVAMTFADGVPESVNAREDATAFRRRRGLGR